MGNFLAIRETILEVSRDIPIDRCIAQLLAEAIATDKRKGAVKPLVLSLADVNTELALQMFFPEDQRRGVLTEIVVFIFQGVCEPLLLIHVVVGLFEGILVQVENVDFFDVVGVFNQVYTHGMSPVTAFIGSVNLC